MYILASILVLFMLQVYKNIFDFLLKVFMPLR